MLLLAGLFGLRFKDRTFWQSLLPTKITSGTWTRSQKYAAATPAFYSRLPTWWSISPTPRARRLQLAGGNILQPRAVKAWSMFLVAITGPRFHRGATTTEPAWKMPVTAWRNDVARFSYAAALQASRHCTRVSARLHCSTTTGCSLAPKAADSRLRSPACH